MITSAAIQILQQLRSTHFTHTATYCSWYSFLLHHIHRAGKFQYSALQLIFGFYSVYIQVIGMTSFSLQKRVTSTQLFITALEVLLVKRRHNIQNVLSQIIFRTMTVTTYFIFFLPASKNRIMLCLLSCHRKQSINKAENCLRNNMPYYLAE
jgi:hypothetical protein